MAHPQLNPSLTAAEIIDRWPQTIPCFFRHHLACVGCPAASFESLAEIAKIYGLELDDFLNELDQVIRQDDLKQSTIQGEKCNRQLNS